MRRTARVLLAALGAAAIAAPFMVGPTEAAPPGGAAPLGVDPAVAGHPTTGPVALAGHVVDASGRPVAGEVAVLAWPSEATQHRFHDGDTIPVPTVGYARASKDGSFAVRLARGDIPAAFVSETGQVNLELVGWAGLQQATWITSVAATPSGGWRVLDTRHEAPTLRLATASNIASDSIQPALGGGCAWILQSSYYNWTNIGAGYPYGSHSSWMTVGSSHTQTLGVAASSSGKYGSWSANGSMTTSDGVSFTWASSIAYRLYDVQVVYGAYQYRCTNGLNYGWQYQPRYPSGGYQTVSTSYPSWGGTCVPVSAGDWTRNQSSGSDFYMAGGVSAAGTIGINLSADSAYASDHSLTYHLTANGHVCGNNNVPSLSSLQKSAA